MSASPEPSRGSAPKFMNEVAVEAVGGAIAALAIGWLGQIPALIGLVVGAVVASRIEPPAAAALRRLKRPSAASAVAPQTESVSAIEPSSPGPTPVGLVPVEPPPPEALLAGPPPESTATQPTPPPSMAARRGRRRPSFRSSLLVTGTAVLLVIVAFTVIDLVRGESLLGDRDATFIPHVPEIPDFPNPTETGVSIPDVAGKTVAEAQALLSEKGFGIAFGEEEFSDDVSLGNVTRSDPAAGDKAAEGSEVTMYVSRGPGGTIPDVAGETAENARALLEADGFAVADNEEFSDDVPLGEITRTSPAAGEQAAKGSEVSMFVSQGVQPPLPDLTIELQQDCSLVPGGAIGGEDQLTLFYRIANVGTSHDETVKVRAVSDTGVSEERTTGVSTGTAVSFAQLIIRREDYGITFRITVTVDPNAEIPETSDDNNSAVLTVRMPSGPSQQPLCS